jgi:iron complex outermembrane receptor protein
LSLLALLGGGLAQEAIADATSSAPSPDSLGDITLEELMEIPVETVSGVSKYEQTTRRAPAGVTIYTATEIRNHGWRTLSDVLRNAPGVHIRSDRFYEYVGNRGFTRPFDYNSRTLLLIDGHRINDPIYQQGSVGTDFILDLDLVDRIEVIQGPGSSVYGSSAFYGAINVIPKTGRDLAGSEASLAVGSEPSAKTRVSIGDRTSGGVEYLVSATQFSSRGEDDFLLPQSWRDAQPAAFTARRALDHDDTEHQNLYARAAWRGLTAETAYMRRKKDVLPPVYFTNTDTPAYGIDERGYALLRASGQPTPDSALDLKLALDYYRYEGLFTPLNSVGGFETFRPYADSFSANTEVRWRQTFADRHTLAVGVEYQENFQQDLGRDNLTTGAAATRVRESSRYASPFAQLDWELTSRLRASAGGRFDAYSTGEERFTPRTGIIWDATEATTFKLLYGESFRVPNIEERYVAEFGIVPNPDIGPELNRSWELIALHRLNSIWSLDTRFHRTRSSDLITVVPSPLNPALLTFGNDQRFLTEGVDLGASATFGSGISLRGAGTIQRTTDDTTHRIVTDAPKTLFKLQASAPVAVDWLRASGELHYVGDRKDSFDEHTGDYLVANFTLRAAQVWHRWDLALSVYNVADTRWSEPKNEGQITSAPRTFVLRATVDF